MPNLGFAILIVVYCAELLFVRTTICRDGCMDNLQFYVLFQQ